MCLHGQIKLYLTVDVTVANKIYGWAKQVKKVKITPIIKLKCFIESSFPFTFNIFILITNIKGDFIGLEMLFYNEKQCK